MPPTAPSVLLVRPSDLYDYLGTEGVQLRLDDHNQATGITIQATADAVIGSVALSIMPLARPILAGTELEFDGAAMTEVVQATTVATATVGATSLTIAPLTGQINALSSASDSGVNLALGERLVKGCYYGTTQVQLYCGANYDISQLAQSWSANRWATSLGARWLCKRLLRACPTGIEEDVKEAMEEMKMVQLGQLQIEGIAKRTASWPFISNVTVDIRYEGAKVRVQQPTSEATPTQYGQFVDWNSILWLNY